jgi:hypothetical protein
VNSKAWRRRQLEAQWAAEETRTRAIAARRELFGNDKLQWCGQKTAVGAVFSDGVRSETVICVPRIPEHLDVSRARMAGEVVELFESPLALPPALVEAGRNTLEYRMCTWKPFVVFRGEDRFLVPAFSQFFRCGEVRGIDLDPSRSETPGDRDAYLTNRSDIEEEILYLEIAR